MAESEDHSGFPDAAAETTARPVPWWTAVRKTALCPPVLFPLGNALLGVAQQNGPAAISESVRLGISTLSSFSRYRAGLKPDAGYYSGAIFIGIQSALWFAKGGLNDCLLGAGFSLFSLVFFLRGRLHSLENKGSQALAAHSPFVRFTRKTLPFLQIFGESVFLVGIGGGALIGLPFTALSLMKATRDLFRPTTGIPANQGASNTAIARFTRKHLSDPQLILAVGYGAQAIFAYPPHEHPILFAANALYALGTARLSFAADDLGADFRAAAREVPGRLKAMAPRLALAGATALACGALPGDAHRPGSPEVLPEKNPATIPTQTAFRPAPLPTFLVAKAVPA